MDGRDLSNALWCGISKDFAFAHGESQWAGNTTVWRVQVVITENRNRNAAVQGDKLSITQAVWGCCCIREPLRGSWLIKLRHWGEWVWERVSIWHDEALMRWQVESSFSCSSPIIIPSFHFVRILSLSINSLPDELLFPVWWFHRFTRCKRFLLPSLLCTSFAFSHFLSVAAFSPSLCSVWISIAAAWQDIQVGEGVNIPQKKINKIKIKGHRRWYPCKGKIGLS